MSDQRDMTELAMTDAFGDGRRQDAEAVAEIEKVRVGRRWGDVEAVINKMSKWLVAGLFGLAILWKHDAETLWAAMGSVVNSVISTTLKHMLNHQRPVSALRSDPGMPSSHAQSIFYVAVYAVLSLVHSLGSDASTVTVGTLILMFASYLSWLRVSQKFHTFSQVFVGSVLGATCGVTWYWLWLSFVKAAFAASVWARLIVVLGSTAFCVAFVVHVIQHWLTDVQ